MHLHESIDKIEIQSPVYRVHTGKGQLIDIVVDEGAGDPLPRQGDMLRVQVHPGTADAWSHDAAWPYVAQGQYVAPGVVSCGGLLFSNPLASGGDAAGMDDLGPVCVLAAWSAPA